MDNVVLEICDRENEISKHVKSHKKEKNNKILFFVILQIGILFFVFSGVCAKYASNYNFMSWQFILIYVGEFFLLGIYAVIWQQVIKRLQLSIAYSCKALSLIWVLIFGALFFGETITLNKFVGGAMVITGITIANLDLWKK